MEISCFFMVQIKYGCSPQWVVFRIQRVMARAVYVSRDQRGAFPGEIQVPRCPDSGHVSRSVNFHTTLSVSVKLSLMLSMFCFQHFGNSLLYSKLNVPVNNIIDTESLNLCQLRVYINYGPLNFLCCDQSGQCQIILLVNGTLNARIF